MARILRSRDELAIFNYTLIKLYIISSAALRLIVVSPPERDDSVHKTKEARSGLHVVLLRG